MNHYIDSIFSYMGINSAARPYLHWIVALTILLIIMYLSKIICRRILIPIVKKITGKTQSTWDDSLFNDKVLNNLSELIPPLIFVLLAPYILAEADALGKFLTKICSIYIVAVAIRFVCSLLTSLYTLSSEHEKLKNRALQGVFQMLKLIAVCIGVIIIISEIVDKDPMNVIAGFGASAAILMLVFKDTIMGLVAGVQLSVNDMLRPGDWITMPKYGADGNVIEVTLTTVKVQNWDKTITTIPPYMLISDSFQNWRGMFDYGGRRIKRSIYLDMRSITFCDEAQTEHFKAEGWLDGAEYDKENLVNLFVFRNYLENYLRNHPRVNSQMILMVRQLQPTPQGLPLELYFFSARTEWILYEKLQAEVFEHIFAILPRFGLRVFQSPSGFDFFEEKNEEPHPLPYSKKKIAKRKKEQMTENSATLFD